MFTDIQAISLDAMGTLIGLRRSPAEIYFEVLRGLGHDLDKVSRLLKAEGIFRRYWKEAEKRLPHGSQARPVAACAVMLISWAFPFSRITSKYPAVFLPELHDFG